MDQLRQKAKQILLQATTTADATLPDKEPITEEPAAKRVKPYVMGDPSELKRQYDEDTSAVLQKRKQPENEAVNAAKKQRRQEKLKQKRAARRPKKRKKKKSQKSKAVDEPQEKDTLLPYLVQKAAGGNPQPTAEKTPEVEPGILVVGLPLLTEENSRTRWRCHRELGTRTFECSNN